jgi:hypothetical protein
MAWVPRLDLLLPCESREQHGKVMCGYHEKGEATSTWQSHGAPTAPPC